MQKNIHFVKWMNKKQIISVLLGCFLVIAPTVKVYSMDTNMNTNATRKDSDSGKSTVNILKLRKKSTWQESMNYAVVIIIFIKQHKGWNLGEYRVRFLGILEHAPLAVFNVTHKDRIEELRKNPPQGFCDGHPLSIQVYLHTEELRVFDDYKEFYRILEEWAEKEKEAVP